MQTSFVGVCVATRARISPVLEEFEAAANAIAPAAREFADNRKHRMGSGDRRECFRRNLHRSVCWKSLPQKTFVLAVAMILVDWHRWWKPRMSVVDFLEP